MYSPPKMPMLASADSSCDFPILTVVAVIAAVAIQVSCCPTWALPYGDTPGGKLESAVLAWKSI